MTTGYLEVPNGTEATTSQDVVRPSRTTRTQRNLTLLVAGAMVVVFALDAFALLHTAVSVLYIACLMLVSIAIGNHRVILAATVITALLLISYVHNHPTSNDPASVAILISSMAGVWMTSAWIIWSGRVGDQLEVSRLDLVRNRELYHTAFDASETPLFEQDYSSVRSYLMELKAEGVTDLGYYGRVHPQYLITCISQLKTNKINDAAMKAIGNIGFTEQTFVAILEAIFEEKRYFTAVTSFPHSNETFQLFVVFPTDERLYSSVLLRLKHVSANQITTPAASAGAPAPAKEATLPMMLQGLKASPDISC